MNLAQHCAPDIKALTFNEPDIVSQLEPAFEKYNEEQFVTVKLPGSSQQVIVSSHSSLGGGRYYDVESSSSFAFDHTTQVRLLTQTIITNVKRTEVVTCVYRKLVTHRVMSWKALKQI